MALNIHDLPLAVGASEPQCGLVALRENGINHFRKRGQLLIEICILLWICY